MHTYLQCASCCPTDVRAENCITFELAGKLAQRNYDEKLLSEVEKQLKNIQNIIKKYEKQEIVQVEELYSVYDRMSPSEEKNGGMRG